MNNVRITWNWPTVRTNGRTLPLSEILHGRVDIRPQGAANWTNLGNVAPSGPSDEFVQTELDFGTWEFQVTVVDTQVPAAESAPEVVAATVVLDAPNGVSALTASLF